MTKEKLQLKIDKCFENAEKMLIENGSLTPMLDIEFIDEKGRNCIMAVVLADGDDKQRRYNFIRGLGLTVGSIKALGKIKEVEAIAMMSEAWFSTLPKDADISKAPRPSEDPNRGEMLIATGMTADGTCLMHAKQMFSVEVKGKRHFTLNDLPEMSDKSGKHQSDLLNQFFIGLKASEQTQYDMSSLKEHFAKMSLDEMIQGGIKALTRQVGGLESEIIKSKLKN